VRAEECRQIQTARLGRFTKIERMGYRMTESSDAEIEKFVGEALAQKLEDVPAADIAAKIDVTLKEATHFDAVHGVEMGDSRVAKFLKECSENITEELCADGKLKSTWEDALKDNDLSQLLKSLATTLLSLINPAFAVPSLAVLVALWLLRKGLNNWCSHSVKQLLAEA
jgi:hypothetical protein